MERPPRSYNLPDSAYPPCDVTKMRIDVLDAIGGSVAGFLHVHSHTDQRSTHDTGRSRPESTTAAILLSGAGGGTSGPSGMYLSIADKLASSQAQIPTLRLDYRLPARTEPCVQDVVAAMAYLEDRCRSSCFILVGWSFGGSPAITLAGTDARVTGVCTLASQTAGTRLITRVSPKPILLLHGSADRMLGASCSEALYAAYGQKGDRKLHIFPGDNHSFSINASVADSMLCDFILRVAGVSMDQGIAEVVKSGLIPNEQKETMMEVGGDLRGSEQID